jgi:DNA-binding HxlR family transcriptional regulator
MLAALLGGRPLVAGVLARHAGISPQTASAHLARLVDSGLVTRRQSGRFRHYALANADVAALLEALARVASAPASTSNALRFARTCYDHLAGKLGVLLTDTLRTRGLIVGTDGYRITPAGEEWLTSLGVDVAELRRSRRVFVRPCLDWTERRDHIAGAMGAAIANTMLERRWVVRIDDTRAVRLTLRGREGLYRSLGLEVTDPG